MLGGGVSLRLGGGFTHNFGIRIRGKIIHETSKSYDTPVTFSQASIRNIVWDIDSKDLSPVLTGRNSLDVTKLTWEGGLTLGLVT